MIAHGYDTDALEIIPEDFIKKQYDRVKNEYCGEVTISTEIFEEPFITSASTRGVINRADLWVTSVISNYADVNGTIIGCDLLINFDWLKTPSTKGPDAITVNWDSQYFSLSEEYGFSGHSYVTDQSTGDKKFYNFDLSPSITTAGGVGWKYDLICPDIESSLQENPGNWVMLFFEPNRTFNSQDYVTINFIIQYTQNSTPDVDSLVFTEQNGRIGVTGSSTNTLTTVTRYVSNVITEA